MSFALHPRLEADTHFVADWPLSHVLLMNDARYPWLVLVPRRADIVELTELDKNDQAVLIEEMARAGKMLKARPGVRKLNFGTLGNLVPQFHVHAVGRYPDDPAWPGPVWGHSVATPYEAHALAAMLAWARSG